VPEPTIYISENMAYLCWDLGETTEPIKPEGEAQRLAQLKRFIEEKIEALERELESLKAVGEIVDKELVGRSFKRGTGEPVTPVSRPVAPSATTQAPVQAEAEAPTVPMLAPMPNERKIELVYRGRNVGVAYVSSEMVRIIPDDKLGLKTTTPPFESFLIRKVLDEIREADTERAGKGEIRPDQILAYDLLEEEALLKQITVRNYGDPDRLNRVVRASAWTFMVMSQK